MEVSSARRPKSRSSILRLILFAAFILIVDQRNDWRTEAKQLAEDSPQPINLNMQETMMTLHRMKRATKQNQRRQTNGHSSNSTKCVISADQAVHYCGFSEELTAPIIPPTQQGQCYVSQKSGREVCYPTYEQLDTTCTDLARAEGEGQGPVPPPSVPHASVRAMAFVAPDDLQRLIKQYYRQNQQPIPKHTDYKINAYLFARYKCDFGYELVDEVDTVFCSDRKWVTVMPECRGKGACKDDNGGCSHSCISPDNVTVECRCPKGMVLDADERTCIKPAPKSMCKNLAGCVCESVNENQMSCTCRPSGEKCFLEKGPPRIFLHPTPPYQVEPGANLNITCSAVGYPFPQSSWRSNAPSDVSFDQKQDPNALYNQVLLVNDLSKNAEFVCHAVNKHGAAEKPIEIVVVGPGPPSLDKVDPGRTSMDVYWHPPEQLNRPITHYTVYYTTNGLQPVKNWKSIDVNEPNRNAVIEDLRPETQYTIRVRGNDNLGPGKLSNAISVNTKEAAKRPVVEITEGEELRISPNESFNLNCNVTRGDPTPIIVWESKGRKISNPQEGRSIALQHKGLLEETSFLCVAENEAGKTSKRIHVIVTGPTAPEKIRAEVDGNDLTIHWQEPRITNGPIQDYTVFYTDDPSLPEDQWQTASSGGRTELKIPDLKELTEYTFKVKGKNINGDGLTSKDQTATTWLKPRPPIVTIRPSDPIEVSPSTQELVVECDAHGVPKPKIVWFWKDAPVEDGKDGFRVYDVSRMEVQNISNSKLIAETTTRSGTVRCEAVNKEGEDQKSLDIKIKGPGTPPLNIVPSAAGDGFKVEWHEPEVPNGDVTNYIIYHSKDPDKPLDEWEKETVSGDKLEDLVTNKDEDTNYFVRLQAVTYDGPGLISAPIAVKTGLKLIPLTVKIELIDPQRSGDEDTVVDPGQEIRFRCVAEGRPAPTLSYTWLPIDNAESGEEPVHIRSSPHESAEHTYVSDVSQTSTFTTRHLLCQARNQDGTVDSRATFVVKKPGSPPLNIDPTIDVDNKVTIKWEGPKYPNGDLDHYKVYLSADPSKPLDQWQKFDVHNVDNPMIEFNRGELEPETPYYVQISAVNKDGEGLKSATTQFTTVSGAPLNAPTDIVDLVEPDNTVNLSWAGPSQPNGQIKAYTVYFTPADDAVSDDNYKQWPKVIVPTSADTGALSLDKDAHQIRPNTPYKVRISATNDLSEGPASDAVTFTTGTGEIAPTITLSPADNPASVDPKKDYTVSCKATGIPEPTVYWTVDGQRTDSSVLQLSNLVKDTIATCHAENNAGSKQEVLRIEVQGPGVPPLNLKADTQPEQALDIEWNPVEYPNGQLTGYVIHYGEIPPDETAPSEWQTVNVPSTEVQTTLKNLKPKTNYAVKVQAVSDRGPGIVSDPVRAKTLPLAPAAPQETKADVHDNNTVSLEFDAVTDPDDTTKKIKDYKILYTDEDPQTDGAVWREMTWTHPDDSPTVSIPIDGQNFKPNTKYNLKIIPQGEIQGTASDPILVETGDGVIAPDKPTFNVDAPDNTVRVTAGTDYVVQCKSEGHPRPKIRWVNENGETISEGTTLRVSDIRVTQKAKCIAENIGGAAEEDFTIFVAGPGNAPEITQMHAHKPRTLEIRFNPPTIPNGEITRYIIYYTPLDDQDPHKQVGQVPSKPVVEWFTHHVTGEKLNEDEKSAILKDYLEPDTAYAIIIQAVNDDGAGPYSNQHTIRTMSRAQEGPPTDLRVEPIDQRSVEVDWKPPENVEEDPIGYEIYYVPANKEIEIDEFDSLPKWIKVPVDSGASVSHVLQNELEPNTEYVFKIRALYPKGPGVFSEPCITKTLPEGSAPIISVSSGGEGVSGTTKIDLLPGSSINVFCNATGSPQPSVNWIRLGSIAIDPSTVKAEETATRWSLKVSNITENTTFNCIAQNPLGTANWSIVLDVIDDVPADWRRALVKAKIEGDDVLLTFDDKIPQHLKDPNEWKIRYTDNPSKPRSEWPEINSDGGPLYNVKLPDAELGKARYILVTDLNTGIETPVFTVVAPSPAKITNLGANINDEIVVDFKPAVGSSNVRNYEIRYWPASDPNNVKSQNVDPNSVSGNVISDLSSDTDYQVQVITTFEDGEILPGTVSSVRTPPEDLHCDCSHACRLDKDSSGKSRVVCYCPSGYELDNDGKTCTRLSGAEQEQIVVQVTPSYDLTDDGRATGFTNIDGSVLPTDKYGQTVDTGEDEPLEVYPTDSLGREIKPILRIDGSRLPTDKDGNTLNQQGKIIETDSENRPLDPDGQLLSKNAQGDWLYPELDQQGRPLPKDKHGRPVYPVVDSDNRLLERNSDGQRVDKQGVPIPTSVYGKPIGPDSSPLPVDPHGNYHWHDSDDFTEEPYSTDDTGRRIHPIVDQQGELLPTSNTGRHVDKNDAEIPLNEFGYPVDPLTGNLLPKNNRDQYIFVERPSADSQQITDHTTRPDDEIQTVTLPTDRPSTTSTTTTTEEPTTTEQERETLPTDEVPPSETRADEHPDITVRPTTSSGQQIVVVDPDSNPLPTNPGNEYILPDGSPVPTNIDNQYVDVHGSPLPVDQYGRVVIWHADDSQTAKTLPTDSSGKVSYPIVGPDGELLKTDSSGRYINQQKEPIPLDDFGKPLNKDGEVLPTNSYGQYVAETDVLPTSQSGSPIVVVGPDSIPLATDSSGRYLAPDGSPIPTSSDHSHYIGIDGSPLPTNIHNQVILPDSPQPEVTLATDSYGKIFYPIVDPHGNLLATDATGQYLSKHNQPIEIQRDDNGRPLDLQGNLLETDSEGRYIFKDPRPTTSSGQYISVVGPDGVLLQRNREGQFIKPDGKPVPTNADMQYINEADSSPLPVDQYGRVVIWNADDTQTAKTLPTDSYGKLSYPIVGPDGQLLPRDPSSGRYTDYRNEPIPLNDFGKPLNKDGQILEINELGQYVHKDIAILPTSDNGRPIVVVNEDSRPLATDSSGRYLQPDGSPVPTSSDRQYLGPDSSVLPTSIYGQAVWPEKQTTGSVLATDETGKQIFPVVRPDGSLLATDSTGRYVDNRGETIEIDEFNRPLNPEGYPLPTNTYNQYVYPEPETPATLVVNPDGHPLARDSQGNFIKPDGSVLEKDSNNNYIGSDKQPLPKNTQGYYVYTDAEPKRLPTDSTGKFIYPVVREDGSLLPTDSTTGRHLNDEGVQIPVNDYGQPINARGDILPVNKDGKFVYKSEPEVRPTDSRTGKLITVVGEDGVLFSTSPSGIYLAPDGSPVPTNDRNEFVGVDGSPLPVSDQGVVVVSPDGDLTAKTLPTDRTNKVIMPVLDEHGQLRPTDYEGLFLDINGSPLEIDEYGRPHYPDGTLLETDSDGNYVYYDKRKKVSKHCFIDGYIELLIVLDTSANVKILDHRLMKETVKTFLKENFDLRENRVRVGIVKFGSEVEVPVALGDYQTGAELLNRLGEARRLRGEPRLGAALRDTVSEFTISGSPNAPKVVLIIKNGKADDNFASPAEMLRDQTKADIFVISVGEDDDDNLQIVGSGNSDRVKHFKNWRVIEPDDLGPFADSICAAIPEERRKPADSVWPTRQPRPTPPHRPCQTIEYEVDLVVVLDSSKFTDDEFKTTLEGVGTLIDESFDLAPDIVRVGFVVFSDKVSVPVALGHYEDKIELLSKIEESERIDGTAIAVKGLDAAEEQFKLHGRRGVSKVVLLITNGNYRGNAALRAKDLREKEDIQLFVLAINPSSNRIASLARLVGVEYSNERLLKIPQIDDIASELNFIRTSLCGHITHTPVTRNSNDPHRTSKREVTFVPDSVTKGLSPPPHLCPPNNQKLSVNIIVDSAGEANADKTSLAEIQRTVDAYFSDYQKKLTDSVRPGINLISVNSNTKSILRVWQNVPADEFTNKMDSLMDVATEENERIRQEIQAACNH